MTHHALSTIWPHVPVAQRRRLIAPLSEMATRYLQTGVIAPFPPSYAANGWC
jgi:hypothetical protein